MPKIQFQYSIVKKLQDNHYLVSHPLYSPYFLAKTASYDTVPMVIKILTLLLISTFLAVLLARIIAYAILLNGRK
jgi:hypothetical protein